MTDVSWTQTRDRVAPENRLRPRLPALSLQDESRRANVMSNSTLSERIAKLNSSGWKLDSEHQLRILLSLHSQPSLGAPWPLMRSIKRLFDVDEDRWKSGEAERDLRLLDTRDYVEISYRHGRLAGPSFVKLTPDGVRLIESLSFAESESSNCERKMSTAKEYLKGYSEILNAVGMKLHQKETFITLAKDHDAPINWPEGRGKRPEAERGELVRWWESVFETLEARRKSDRDRKLSASESYDYGKSGKVAPEIGGEIRSRNSKRSD